MKIERISENQIRCTLTGTDLSSRNLNLIELAYGTDKARGLFQEMMQKASREVGFQADDTPLMIEAIPLSSESIMLIITKVDDPEELDARFSRFSPSSEDTAQAPAFPRELLEGAEQLLSMLSEASHDAGKDGKTEETGDEEARSGAVPAVRCFLFDTLDEVITAAHAVDPSFDGESVLYKDPASGTFTLVLRELEPDSKSFVRTANRLSEFGTPLRAGAHSESYYQEHYELMIGEKALEKLYGI